MGNPVDTSECSCPEGRTTALGIDVGAHGVKAVVADARGRIVRSLDRALAKGAGSDPHLLIKEICSIVTSLHAGSIDEPADEPARVVGVCLPGVVDEREGGVVHSADLGLEEVPLADLLSQALPSAEVLLSQNVRCGAWAESRWGAGGASSLHLSIERRIASAVLLDGSPVLGGGWAGQVGEVLVSDPDWSGERARLEDVASVDAIVKRYTAGIVDDSFGGQSDSTASGLDHLLNAMRSGDREARRVWETALDGLADFIARGAGLLGALDVVVSSTLTQAGEAVFLEPLRVRVADLMAGLPVPAVLSARLGLWAPALGAAGRALDD